MRLLCNGHSVDLQADTQLEFTKKNILFGFDKIETERTTEFALPVTPTNDRIFALARVPAYDGRSMRVRFDAELQDGMVVKTGYLYISKYADRHYSAVMICGELVALKRIKEAGKLVDVVDDVVRAVGEVTPANLRADTLARVNYRHDDPEKPIAMSVSLSWLVRNVASRYGIHLNLPEYVDKMRIVAPKTYGMKKEDLTINNEGLGTLPVSGDDPTEPQNILTTGCSLLEPTNALVRQYAVDRTSHAIHKDWQYLVRGFKALQSITIEFPEDFSSDLFLIRIHSAEDIRFVGDYSFDKPYGSGETYDDETGACTTSDNARVTGEPLAGRSVELAFDGIYTFVRIEDFINTYDESTLYERNGWCFHMGNYEQQIQAKGTNEQVTNTNEYVRLIDNLPDVGVMDLLKSISAIMGAPLYLDNDVLSLDSLDFSSWQVADWSNRLTRLSAVTRTFADYAQRNIVAFDDDELVADSPTTDYTIDNVNISEEQVLQKIPLSPASAYDDDSALAYVRDAYEEPKKYMLMTTNEEGGSEYMSRVVMTKSEGIQRLCTRSTGVEASFSLNPYQFDQLKPKTIILMNGTRYVWTEAQYADGVANMKLFRI